MKPINRERVYINDVSPRDGLQIEAAFVPTEDKVALIDALSHHVEEEQTQMFPKAQKTKLDLLELGARIETRKAELLANEKQEPKQSKQSVSSILSLLSID
jgi:isopropylmalate/homocitrate/citramalate synthase